MIEHYSGSPCCPKFEPELWDDKEIVWKDKLFARHKVTNFFRSPPNFEQTISKLKEAGAVGQKPLMMADDNALWSTDVYVEIEKEVEKIEELEMEMVKVSGTFISKVFEGPYKHADKWMKEMEEHVKSKGKQLKRMFFFYTTCDRCSEIYGKEYTAILAEVE
jgi:hypothetical protein